jgi:hypothetical protein|tara:strand:+ start:2818 stop:2928 length:111 start_codon:yes stop_codon:yes gene_type:complete
MVNKILLITTGNRPEQIMDEYKEITSNSLYGKEFIP